ncbi:MAG: NAD(P)/FAD-dependent oxidoreductase [Phycisphaerales bacterium]
MVVVEKGVFPRDHIGESQLPPIGRVLDEMGAWEKIGAAGFPVKLGATYTSDKTTEPWVFGFIPLSEVRDDPRPGKYEGSRRRVVFQVDRAKYDEILLDHARSLGAQVLQPAKVARRRGGCAARVCPAYPRRRSRRRTRGTSCTRRVWARELGGAGVRGCRGVPARVREPRRGP